MNGKGIVHKVIGTLALLCVTSLAQATVVWDWSFGSEQGQFVTSGELVGGAAVAGNYMLEDFSVSASGFRAAIGSLSGGQYGADAFGTVLPYSFTWDGSNVTFWDSAGSNAFDWWVFVDLTTINTIHFFGYDVGNINDPTSAALFSNVTNRPVTQAKINVDPSVTAVPEPSTLLLLAMGLFGLGFSGAKRRSKREQERVA